MSASAPPDLLLPQPAVDNTVGAWIIGAFCSVSLSGVAYLQAYRYWQSFPRDPKIMKIWVGTVITLETLSTTLVLHTSYYYIVTHYWNPLFLFLAPPVWSIKIFPVVGFVTGMVCQCFFARRVWMSMLSPHLLSYETQSYVSVEEISACSSCSGEYIFYIILS
ncbi:hypothetical protein BD309DRAFT_513668 [Dichomitus squalens]|nr:hypothetical protein BD309DRAFT_513668 [Dichomitus squalens]